MAEAVNVGKLVITITGDTKDLEAAGKRVGKSLGKVEKDTQSAARTAVASFQGIAAAIVPAVTAATALTAAMAAFQNAVSRITALDNLSQSTGIAIGQLDKLSAIAQMAGVEFEALEQAAREFGSRMATELASSTSRGSQAIRALGIDVKDSAGNIRNLGDLLPELADKFSRYADGSNKAALAAALFGEEAGPKLIPLLNRGAAGLDELRRKIGTTLTEADRQRARDYQQAVGELARAFEEFGTELARIAAGPAGEFIRKITEAVRAIGRTPDAARQAAVAFSEFGRETAKLEGQLSLLSKEHARLTQLYMDGKISLARYDEVVGRIIEHTGILRDRLADARRERDKLMIGEWQTTVQLPEAPKVDSDAIQEAQFQVSQLMDRLTGTREIFDPLNKSWQEHQKVVQQTLAAVNSAYDKSGDRRRALAQINHQLALADQQGMLDTASLAAQTITQLWPKQKGAAIASAIINTAVGVTKALTGGIPPWNIAQAALVAAAGAAQIASIRSTNVNGTSGGASAAPAASGAAAQPAGPEQAAPERAVTIQIPGASIFSTAQVEDLIRAINTEVGNGAVMIATKVLPT